MWTQCGFHMDTMWFLCGHHMVSMWLIFHHFYIISVVDRSRKIANLWKPVTSLIMVRFSIREKFWKALGLLYLHVVSISQISHLAWKEMCKRIRGVCGVCGVLKTPQTPQNLSHISFHAEISQDFTKRHHRHHKFSHTSHFIPKSHEIWLIDTTMWCLKDTTDTTKSLAHLISCQNLVRFH